MASNMWKQYPLINSELTRVKSVITKKIKLADPQLQDAIKKMLSSGGKFLRPSLCLLFAHVNSTHVDDRLIEVAASLEVLHTATLIHDDVIDDSPKRRGRVSIQAAFGKDIAVYAGDYLFTVFFDLITKTMHDSPYLAVNATTMRQILAGEIEQMNHRFDRKRSVDQYLQSVKGKTAALFRLATEEGAHFSGADPKQTQLAASIGENIGISFQIVDDLLDYQEGQHLNKPVLEDLATGVYSLPLILAMQNQPNRFTVLKKGRQMTLADMETVKRNVISAGGLQAARELAAKYTARSQAAIRQLPRGQVQTILLTTTSHLLDRTR